MSLATKEIINNESDIEEYLEDVKDGKTPVVFINWKVVKACILIIIQLEVITFFASFHVYDSPFMVFVDWAFFLKSQQVEIVPVIIAGMSAGSNIKIQKMRDKIVTDNKAILEEKDHEIKVQTGQITNLNQTIWEQKEEIYKLKIRLDDLATTKSVTEEAIKRAEQL